MSADANGLDEIRSAWPTLAEPIRAGILAMIWAAMPGSGSTEGKPAGANNRTRQNERKRD